MMEYRFLKLRADFRGMGGYSPLPRDLTLEAALLSLVRVTGLSMRGLLVWIGSWLVACEVELVVCAVVFDHFGLGPSGQTALAICWGCGAGGLWLPPLFLLAWARRCSVGDGAGVLRFLVSEAEYSGLFGDLEEARRKRAVRLGALQADAWRRRQVLLLIAALLWDRSRRALSAVARGAMGR